MDIQNIQKINTMAKGLLDRGIASSMEEAVKIAENLCNKNDELPQATGPQGATPVWSASAVSPSQPESEADAQLRTLNFRLNEHQRHIRELQEKIDSLTQQLANIEARAATRPQPRVVGVVEQPTDEATEATATPTAAVREAPKQVVVVDASTGRQVTVTEQNSNSDSMGKRFHAKVGTYVPDDVSVEKMFYCGGK